VLRPLGNNYITMKAVVIHEFYESLSQLHVSTVPKPEPSSSSLLIQVLAAGVNFVDTLYARGQHQNNKSHVLPPFVLGLEFAGIVVSAPAASQWKAGDQVFGDHGGSYAEYISVPVEQAKNLQRIPTGWTAVEAAGLGATLPVSYGALTAGGLKAGETVLVHSAAGGLGIMAVQIASALGCFVIGTAGSPSKCAYAKSFGAAECFDYSESNWHQRVLEATKGKGVDVVYDPVGLVGLSLKCIAHRGRVLVVGFAGRDSSSMEAIKMNRVLLKQVSLIGYRYGESLRRYPEEKNRIWGELRPLIDSGKIKPTVFSAYETLDGVPKALDDLSSRKVSGKAVIKVAEDEASGSKSKL